MICTPIKLPDGTTAIACGRGPKRKRCACGKPGTLLCDWKLGNGKTCDKPICDHHAQQVAPDNHLCPEHQEAYADWAAKRMVL